MQNEPMQSGRAAQPLLLFLLAFKSTQKNCAHRAGLLRWSIKCMMARVKSHMIADALIFHKNLEFDGLMCTVGFV